MPEKEYQRLTRARPRAKFAVISSGNSSLWLGKDHLLCIDTNGYTESYKRFYFRDIQALIIRKTERQKWWGLILAVVAAGFLIPAALSSEVALKYVFGSVGGLFVLLFLINLALGPAAACQIRTAVQLEDLPSLNRLRRARAVLGRLRSFVLAAQGALAPEEILVRLQELSAPAASGPVGAANPLRSVVGAGDAPPRML